MKHGALHSTALTHSTLVALSCMFTLTGCVMMKPHYKSMQQLRKEAAVNYSQQVLDTIVSVRDQAQLPVMFSVEAGGSTWVPNYSISAVFLAPLYGLAGLGKRVSPGIAGTPGIRAPAAPGEASLTSTISGGESLTSTLQYNDFGAAAMTRVNALYSLLCFPIHYGDVVLSNGTLFTIVDEADTKENMLFWSETREGRYLGVTPEKNEHFLAFAHDVTYWVQHASPNASDLRSTAGSIFSFSAAYAPAEDALTQAVLAKLGAQKAIGQAQKKLQDKQQEFEAFKAQAQESKTDPAILQTLLTFEQEELQSQQQAAASISAQLGKAASDIATNKQQLGFLLASLRVTLTLIQKHDPDLGNLPVANLIKSLQDRIDIILSEDQTMITALQAYPLPRAAGLTAEDSVDELYRERFESLPQQFSPALQGTQ